MSGKADAVTGVISVAIFGVQATFTAPDLALWAQVIVNAAPAILILFLIWRIVTLDRQHSECNKNWKQTREQLSLVYETLLDESIRCRLPSKHEFMKGNFDLDELKEDK